MLNLKKRIKALQENTSSLEVKEICKEIVENFVDVPENQLASSLVEKLQKIEDSDKYVQKFIEVTNRILDVTNLGVEKSLTELSALRKEVKETQIYNYPALTYNLNKIESALKIQKTPEYMLIDPMIECLKTFTWDPTIDGIHKLLKENREKLDESITVAKSIYTLSSIKGSFMYEGVLAKLEEHFVNPTQSSRSSIIEDLKKFSFTQEARSLSESLKKIQGKNGSIQIIAENSRCEISSVYSPVVIHEGNEILFVKGNFYSKKDNTITKITEAEKLPETYRELCRIVSSPNVFVKEGKISFFVKRNKVEIFEGEKGIEVSFNGSKVPTNDLAKHMVSAGLFRIDEAQMAYDVQKISESFKNIYDLDFAKLIESKVYQGSYVILMKTGDNISLTKVNESSKLNEFFTNLNATQARNIVLEFLGYDIKESMAEYIEQDEKKLNSLRESKAKIVENIAIVESQINKLELASKDPVLNDSLEVKELRELLDKEMGKLKSQYTSISNQIKNFESAVSEAGYDVGDEVKIIESGECATVTAINSSRNTISVITAAGKTLEVDTKKVTSVEADIEKAKDKNAEDDDKKKA